MMGLGSVLAALIMYIAVKETTRSIGASIIAATALMTKSVLITKNVKHFKSVEGLKIKIPY